MIDRRIEMKEARNAVSRAKVSHCGPCTGKIDLILSRNQQTTENFLNKSVLAPPFACVPVHFLPTF
jgi:hypothetical protein